MSVYYKLIFKFKADRARQAQQFDHSLLEEDLSKDLTTNRISRILNQIFRFRGLSNLVSF